ncbi:glycosyltransferase family 2 protein [Enterobacter mori]|uniref:glycosyltransferase family 2 protein n=1 Tax=Enterobacter mori TaxID=539813 RepID=UPI003F62A309
MIEPLVSVIMPSYNSESTIEESILSVLNQKYENWELIISDDNSCDNTINIIQAYAEKDHRIKLITHSINSGAGFARNASIEKAAGKYIAFLDSDDLWDEGKLSTQIASMEENNLDFTYSYYRKIDMQGHLGKIISPPSTITYAELLKSNVIGCLTAIYNQESLGKTFMPLIRKRQDMALWLDLLKKTEKAYCIPSILAYYREGQKSLSSNKYKILISQWNFYRDYIGLNVFKSAYYFAFYLYKAIRKHGM